MTDNWEQLVVFFLVGATIITLANFLSRIAYDMLKARYAWGDDKFWRELLETDHFFQEIENHINTSINRPQDEWVEVYNRNIHYLLFTLRRFRSLWLDEFIERLNKSKLETHNLQARFTNGLMVRNIPNLTRAVKLANDEQWVVGEILSSENSTGDNPFLIVWGSVEEGYLRLWLETYEESLDLSNIRLELLMEDDEGKIVAVKPNFYQCNMVYQVKLEASGLHLEDYCNAVVRLYNLNSPGEGLENELKMDAAA